MVVRWGVGEGIEFGQSNPQCRNRPGSVNGLGRFGIHFFSGEFGVGSCSLPWKTVSRCFKIKGFHLGDWCCPPVVFC